jgi:hypothetical protein
MMGRKRSAKATGKGFIESPLNEALSLGERLSYIDKANRGFSTRSGRGHGRTTPHGRGKKIKQIPFRGKKDSIHFLEACVTDYR